MMPAFFSIALPEILERLVPAVVSGIDTRQATSWAQRLRGLGESVAAKPWAAGLDRRLLRAYDRFDRISLPAGKATIALLTSQMHFERETPNQAFDWNAIASDDLPTNGALPPLARAAIRSQLVGIRIQSNELEIAVDLSADLSRDLREMGLSERDRKLVAPPLDHIRIVQTYESGECDTSVIEDLQAPPEYYTSFLHGRFYLQSARFKKARTAFEHCLELLEKQPSADLRFGVIVRLHLARAQFYTQHLPEALESFKQVSRRFSSLGLRNAKLAAEIGKANVYRVVRRTDEARGVLKSTLNEARELGLKKTTFQALMGLAALEMTDVDAQKVEHARELLGEAESYLSPLNRKERCTLYRGKAKLEYQAKRPDLAEKYVRRALDLLPDGTCDEAALLRADMASDAAWYEARSGRADKASAALDKSIGEIEERIVRRRDSQYHEEPGPWYFLNRMWRQKAYLELKAGQARSASKSCLEARRLMREWGEENDRVLSKIVFLEGLGFALLRQPGRSIRYFEKAARFGAAAGVDDPIRRYVEQLRAQAGSAFLSELALKIIEGLREAQKSTKTEIYRTELIRAMKPEQRDAVGSDWMRNKARAVTDRGLGPEKARAEAVGRLKEIESKFESTGDYRHTVHALGQLERLALLGSVYSFGKATAEDLEIDDQDPQWRLHLGALKDVGLILEENDVFSITPKGKEYAIEVGLDRLPMI